MNTQQSEAVREHVVAVVNELTPAELHELIFGSYLEVREQMLVPLAA